MSKRSKKGGMKGCTIKNGCKSKSGGLTAKGVDDDQQKNRI